MGRRRNWSVTASRRYAAGSPPSRSTRARSRRAYGFCVGRGLESARRWASHWDRNTTASKMFEIADALGRGATEIDMVINIRELQAGRLDVVRQEIGSMVRLCRKQKAISKVILETCYLNEAEKLTVCRLAREESADFVKTSTGFGSDGAKVEDVALMRRAVGPHIGVKASGGVHTLQTALGHDRSGATARHVHGVEIVRQFSERGFP